ncbi:MAG: PDZ domain-containing protein [Candidatus Firestonebacteria bacterium]|nr:PDZ domain-containing protein [Candidatus Firestonebacteria bacterium]
MPVQQIHGEFLFERNKKVVLLRTIFIGISLIFSSCIWTNKSVKSASLNFSKEIAVEKAISKVKPALVRIFVVATSYENGREIKRESAGSGVIINQEGYIVTNHHVVGRSTYISCTLSNKEEIEAELVGTDPLADIAVIKLKTDKKRIFPIASFGNSSLVKEGDTILAMGSPLALSQSVTMGIVSNTEMVIPQLFWPFNIFELDGENVGSIVRWIGHDAPIYGGNSGGPLVNLDGEIIGINEIGLGLSGAIPGDLAKKVALLLIKNREVTRSWIGLEVQPLLKSSKFAKGVLISGTIENSPAAKAGFLPGDILINLAEQDVNVNFVEQLPLFNQYLMDIPVGKEANATVMRNGEELFLRVIPIKREKARPDVFEIKSWGMTASNLSMAAAQEMRRDNNEGVLIINVRPGGPCDEAKPAVRAKDVIVEVNGIQIKNIQDFITVTEKILGKNTSPVPVLVSFERRYEKYMTMVKVGDKDWEDRGGEVKKAWMGIGIQVLTNDLSKALGVEGKTGVRITAIYPDSPAAKAGFAIGDLIVNLDGEPINCSEPQDIEVLPALIRQYKIGTTALFTILRFETVKETGLKELKTLNIKVELGTSPPMDKEMKKYHDKDYEFTARDATFMDKVYTEKSLSENAGVLVEAVEEGGWAALGHLAVGDYILEINGQLVLNVNVMEKIMQEIKTKQSEYIVFKVQRGIHKIFIELKGDGYDY